MPDARLRLGAQGEEVVEPMREGHGGGDLLFDSRTTGWRSLHVALLRQPATADGFVPGADAHLVSTLLTGWKRASVLGGDGWRSTTTGPGTVSSTPPGRDTRIRWSSGSAEPLRHLAVRIPGAVLRRAAQELDGARVVPDPPEQLGVPDPMLAGVLAGLLRSAEAGEPELYAASAAEFLAVHVLVRHGGADAVAASRGHERRRAEELERLLHDRLADPIDLGDLAATAGLSRYRTVRLLRDATGETPGRYLTRIRMERAREQLAGTSVPVAEVARRCGYADLTQFSRAFRREHGASPSAYRRART